MKYLTCADTAKLIRQTLKEAYPNVKFGVRSKTYAGGASINVDYVDGPAVDNVKALVAVYEGSYFDGMQDYKGLNFAAIDGEEVRFGADFIFVNRKFTDATIQVAIDQLYKNFAGNFKDTTDSKATVEQFKTGALYNKYIPGYGNAYYDAMQAMIYKELEKIGAELEPVVTALLKRVKSLGDDGYGYGCTGRIAA